ncbi:MAG: hypothetical protein CML24_09800 [Rhizobiales bacterium]|nr:hypothetical protein [Hyphomicrobiales bacterium]
MTEEELKLEYALSELAERFPGEKLEIISMFDIAHSGWECDSPGALIRRDGVPELVIIDQTGGDERTVREILEAKVGEYERLAAATRNVLAQQMVLEGLREFGTEPPQPGDEMPEEHCGYEYTLERNPGESDEEYAERKSLFAELQKSGGRLVRRVGDLTDEEMRLISEAKMPPDRDPEREAVEQTPEVEERHVDDMKKRGLKSSLEPPESALKKLRDLADEHPDEKLDLHGGMKDDDDGQNSET